MSDMSPTLSRIFLGSRSDRHRLSHGDGATRTWGDFRRDVASLAAQARLREKRRWVIVSDDAYAFAVGLFATLVNGGDAILPANHQAAFLRNLMANADGCLLHGASAYGPEPAIPILGGQAGDRALDDALSRAAIDADAARVVLYTSGSTGSPRAFARPLRCLQAEIVTLETLFGRPRPEVVLATVPPRHIYGLLFRLLWPLAVGRPFCGGQIRYPEELVAAVSNNGPAILVSTPAFLTRALPIIEAAPPRSRLRVFSSGGALPSPVAAAYNSLLDEPVVEVYGSTESGGIGYRSVVDATGTEPWTLLPDVNVRVEAETGRVRVRSPHVPDRRWVATGDRGHLLADGRLELRGRADRIVKLEQVRVSLREVERRLRTSPLVAETSALALTEAGRESLAVVTVPSAEGWARLAHAGKQALKEELLALLRPHFEAVSLPRRWRFVREMPAGELGKPALAPLMDMFAADRGRILLPQVIWQNTEEEESEARLRLRIPIELFYFNGHFDAAPVLPGVVQVAWAIGFAEEQFAIANVEEVMNLKFYRVLQPDDEVALHLKYDAVKPRLYFDYSADGHLYSSGQIAFGASRQ